MTKLSMKLNARNGYVRKANLIFMEEISFVLTVLGFLIALFPIQSLRKRMRHVFTDSLSNIGNVKKSLSKRSVVQASEYKVVRDLNLPIDYLYQMFRDQALFLNQKFESGEKIDTIISDRNEEAKAFYILYLKQRYNYVFDVDLEGLQKSKNWIDDLVIYIIRRFKRIIRKSLFIRLAKEIIEGDDLNVTALDNAELLEKLDDDLEKHNSCIVLFQSDFVIANAIEELLFFKRKVKNVYILTGSFDVLKSLPVRYYVPNFDINTFLLLELSRCYPWAINSEQTLSSKTTMDVAGVAIKRYKSDLVRSLYNYHISGDIELVQIINEHYNVHESIETNSDQLERNLTRYVERKMSDLTEKETLVFKMLVHSPVSLYLKDFEVLCEYLKINVLDTRVKILNTGFVRVSSFASYHNIVYDVLSLYLMDAGSAEFITSKNLQGIEELRLCDLPDTRLPELLESARYNCYPSWEGFYVGDVLKNYIEFEDDDINQIRSFCKHLKANIKDNYSQLCYDVMELSTFEPFDIENIDWSQIADLDHEDAFRDFGLHFNSLNKNHSTKRYTMIRSYTSKLTKLTFDNPIISYADIYSPIASDILISYNNPSQFMYLYLYLYLFENQK